MNAEKFNVISSVKRGFTLIEMLVVIGIIAILVGVVSGAYGKMTAKAEKIRAQELVHEVATALTKIYEQEGCWPAAIRNAIQEGECQGRLSSDNRAALLLAQNKYLTLAMNAGKTQLIGRDRFGILTPWAAKVVERNKNVKIGDKINGSASVKDNILHFAIDTDGDGYIQNVKVSGGGMEGQGLTIRATAVVWCIGKSGGNGGSPWSYSKGLKHDDAYSWAYGQTQNIPSDKK